MSGGRASNLLGTQSSLQTHHGTHDVRYVLVHFDAAIVSIIATTAQLNTRIRTLSDETDLIAKWRKLPNLSHKFSGSSLYRLLDPRQ